MDVQSLHNDYVRINKMMRSKGIFLEESLHKEYYTGYEYATLYDWDQYFEGIVELYLGWDTRLLKNGVEIFLDYQKDDGHIQRSSSAGYPAQLTEHVKPFLAQISLLIYKKDKSLSFLTPQYYQKMKKYLLYWLEDRDQNHNHLSVWDSAMHTGMDNQHERAGRWSEFYCEGADLNSFLVRECRAFAQIACLLGHADDQELFLGYAKKISEAVQTLLWNEQDGLFYDLDQRTGKQIKVNYLGSFATLWAGIPTEEQAKRMVHEHLMNPGEYLRPFPFPVLSKSEPGYSETPLEGDIGCCWRAQTWIPTNYYLSHGLRAYGYTALASYLSKKTYENVKAIGDREYYNTESKSGNGLNPFWGWSLLAYFMPLEDSLGLDPTSLELDIKSLASVTVL